MILFALACVAAHGLLVESSHGQQVAAKSVSPSIDEAQLASAGIRKLAGQHLLLYTDLPSGPEIDSLPAVFDQAVPLWAAYFGIDPARTADWQVRGFLIGDRQKFAALGLLPDDNALAHGYSKGSDLWLFDQPTDYYRRHLLLHEGTHAFMAKFLGGCGPGWYSEGMAEMLATHHPDHKGVRNLFSKQGGILQRQRAEKAPDSFATIRNEAEKRLPSPFVLGIMPLSRCEVPMLGRIKLIRDAVGSEKTLTLEEVMAIDNRRQPGNAEYAWCWAAAKFLDSHPRYQERFRALSKHVQDPTFNDLVRREFAADWDELLAEWQAFVATLDHGYDFERMAIDFKRGTPLSRTSQTGRGGRREVTIAADRGWQSSGVWLEAGKTYRVTARGRYPIAVEKGVAWPCEPGGVTIEYYDGRPLGMLLGAIFEGGRGKEEGGGATAKEMSFAKPLAIGLGAKITPRVNGTLYLRVNDSAARLGDNRGTLTIRIDD